MDQLTGLTRRLPRWFVLLLGLALLGLGFDALVRGVVETPSSVSFFRSQVARADQPATYWALVLAYGAGAAMFLVAAWRRFRQPGAAAFEPAPPAPPRPTWALVLAWLGALFAAALLGGAVWAHFALDPIISLPFVAVLGCGGLYLGFASVGYIVTGRVQ